MYLSILKISSIFILLIAITCFFTATFIKYFYFNEEILDIPIVESDIQNIKTLSESSVEKTEQMSVEIEILNDKNEKNAEQKLSINNKKPELIPFKVVNQDNSKKENVNTKEQFLYKSQTIQDNKEKIKNKKSKKNNKNNKLNKYRVQLGSFKNKDRAIKALENLESIYFKIFKNIKLEIYTLKKDDYLIHRVWTELIKKKQALDLCNNLKYKKINCILQVEEN